MFLFPLFSFAEPGFSRDAELMVSQRKRCSQWGSLCLSRLGPGPKRSCLWAGVALQDLTAWGLVVAELNKALPMKSQFPQVPCSIFVISVFFEMNLTVAFLEFYLTEVRTKQPTFAADLWKTIIIRPSGKKAFLAFQEWLRACSWRIDFLWLPHDSDSAVQKKKCWNK